MDSNSDPEGQWRQGLTTHQEFNDGRRPWQRGGIIPHAGREERDGTDDSKKTFADVAGCDEAIAKLQRVSKWLRSSAWYALFRAKIPKGLLLVGPPGTGKTLLAQALAGETDANLFPVAASEFVEMFVGVGASRIRELFEQATEARRNSGKPSIIFIDELDAVGKKRSGSGSYGNPERDQTLNQLLTCMQGFKPSSGILVLAATNLPDSLDEALLRPGRFDYHVSVDYPDIDGREKIFQVHTRGRSLAPDVDLRLLASRTTNFAGAHIAMLCNEAAVLAAERQENLTVGLSDAQLAELPHEISKKDFERALDYLRYGDELVSRMRTQSHEEAWATCVHEAGHAVVATMTRADPVSKITRVIRAKSLGMMQSHPMTERYTLSEAELESRIMTCLAGQLAQQEILGFRDTGAYSDLQEANRLARLMVGAYGMSKLGPLHFPLDAQGFPTVQLGPLLTTGFEQGWGEILKRCWEKTRQIVQEEIPRIQRIAEALMEEETILADRFQELFAE